MADPHLSDFTEAEGGVKLERQSSSSPPPDNRTVSVETSPKRSNFPLPRELRDEIYGYVLEPVALDEAHSGSFSRSYHFDSGLLSVNKAVGADASKYIREHHRLIKIEFDCPGLAYHLQVFQVPSASAGDLEYCKIHCISLEIRWPDSPFLNFPWKRWQTRRDMRPRSFAPSYSPWDEARGTLLLLEKDMAELWPVLQLLCCHSQPNRLIILSKPKERLSVFETYPGWSVPSLRVERMTGTNVDHGGLQMRSGQVFVEGLQAVSGSCYDLVLHGFSSDILATLQASAAPQLIPAEALAWNRLETFRQIKQKADSLVSSLGPRCGLAAYDLLLDWIKVGIDGDDPGGVETAALVLTTGTIMRRWKDLLLDLQLSYAQVAFRAKDVSTAVEAIHEARRLLGTANLPPIFEHLECLLHIIGDGNSIIVSVNSIVNYLHALNSLPSDPYLAYDIAILQDGLQLRLKSSRHSIALGHDWSVYTMPLRFNCSQSEAAPEGERPKRLIGWQDVECVPHLTKAEKESIHAIEKDRGLPLSSFEAV